MDEKEFLERLTEVAHWERPKINAADPRRIKRGRKSVEELEWEENEEQLLGQEIQTGPNDTVPPIVTKLKYQKTQCPDCDRTVEGRCVQMRYCVSNKGHWRENCVTCGFYRDPRTGEFTLSSRESQTVWMAYTRGTGKYVSKYQQPEAKPQFKTIETEDNIIYIREPISKPEI